MKTKLLIVDDHLLVREGLKLILEANESFEVIGEAQNGKKALDFLEYELPDVILLDLKMPIMSGLETMDQIKTRKLEIPIIILTTYNEDNLMIKGLKAGARGYLLKDTDRYNLYRTIESAVRGETLIQPEIMEKLLHINDASFSINNDTMNNQQLSKKEIYIITKVAKGYRNKEIAFELGIAERTVKSRLTNIYNKLGVNSRSEAVSVAIKQGYIGL
ncbi:two-component system response regulator [Oceanobacillus sp. E9]|uniref:response regulator n=1 Tax=Oceanobacillus sp. E9 TaxID=1742575 RepID=UPI00084E856C|nr:response regulator transcription factor [Oceanobacillus sp. E9]OEH54092.1 two-component system response regulator [Oceanobacillus sp. E9]